MQTGRGLEALIPKKSARSLRAAAKNAKKKESRGVFFVDIGKIVANEHQPRKTFVKGGLAELAFSIRQHGILQPLLVEKYEEETGKGVEVRYHILAGERRLRAARMAGLRQVPVVIRQAHDNRTRLLLSLIENVQREDLNPMERAEAFARLRDDFHLSQEEIAKRVGKSREAVANALRLLQLDVDIRSAVRGGELSEGHARTLLSVPQEARTTFFEQLKENPVSVREAEAAARELTGFAQVPRRVADPRRARDEERLRKVFDVPVRITISGKRGSVAFAFGSQEEFRSLLKKFLENQP